MSPFYVNMPPIQENIQGLKYSADQVVRHPVGMRTNAIKLALNEHRPGPMQRLGVITLALLRRAAGNERPLLAEVKPCGAERLGHPAILWSNVVQNFKSQSNSMVRRMLGLKWKPNHKSSCRIWCSIESLLMPDETKNTPNSASSTGTAATGADSVFHEQPQEKAFPTVAVAIAALVVVVAIVALLVVGRHRAGPSGGAAYASSLVVSGLQVSQSESLSGGRSTYVDGHVVNRGEKTVTAATVEAQFAGGAQPQTLTAPVSVIRTREPYVDTEPLSAAPLAPGAQADFRLIFEGVNESWDQQMPALRVVEVSTK
jgi:hypothetical protein